MRRALSASVFRLARGTQQVSLFFGGIATLGFVISLIMLIFNHKHGAAHYGDLTVRRWLWVFPAIAVAAWLVGFRFVTGVFAYVGARLLPFEDRMWLTAAVDVSRQTGEPIPPLNSLWRERDEARERGDLAI